MTDRWEEINRIYDAAVGLREEVESLLACDRQAQQFIARPALQVTLCRFWWLSGFSVAVA